MKKSTIITIAAVAVVGFWLVGAYNGMVTSEEEVDTAWSQVENVYQRRADLIPNLVNTVKGYASHESETLEGVVNARAKATQVTVDAENLTPEQLQKFNEAQGELSSALGRLLAVTEAYPDLKANQNFLELQAQLEGTENRIATERMKFNETAKGYNTLIRQFPKNIIASVFGFDKKPYFEAQEGADKAPAVQF
jgi:LemA protein